MRTMERRNLELEQKFRKQFTRRCWFFLFVTILLYLILASRFAVDFIKIKLFMFITKHITTF